MGVATVGVIGVLVRSRGQSTSAPVGALVRAPVGPRAVVLVVARRRTCRARTTQPDEIHAAAKEESRPEDDALVEGGVEWRGGE